MTLYQNTKSAATGAAKIISIDEVDRIRPGDEVVFVSRVSTDDQRHEPKIAVLQVVHRQLGIRQPFEALLHTFKGSGKIGTTLGDKYRVWLERILRAGLVKLGAGGTLYVVYVLRGRISRPSSYNKDIPATWCHTQPDIDAFNEWLCQCFGQDASKITFVSVLDGNEVEERRIESALGTNYDKMNKYKTTKRISPEDGRRLKAEALSLASARGMNAGEILRHFERMLEPPVTIQAIRKWLKSAGLSNEPGRPVNRNNGIIIETATTTQIDTTPVLERCVSDAGSGEGLTQNPPLPVVGIAPNIGSVNGIEPAQQSTPIPFYNESERGIFAARAYEASRDNDKTLTQVDVAKQHKVSVATLQDAMRLPETERQMVLDEGKRVYKITNGKRGNIPELAEGIYCRILSGTLREDAIEDAAALSGIRKGTLRMAVQKITTEREAPAHVIQKIREGKLDERTVCAALDMRRNGCNDDWVIKILDKGGR